MPSSKSCRLFLKGITKVLLRQDLWPSCFYASKFEFNLFTFGAKSFLLTFTLVKERFKKRTGKELNKWVFIILNIYSFLNLF